MNDDTISRQAAIAYAISGLTREFDGEKWIRVSEVRESLQTMPSAERRGRWKFNIDDEGWSWDKPYMCDQCGEWVEKVFKFCPYCGAKMEGEEE